MEKFNIKYFFCDDFTFKKGIWVGIFRFSVEINHLGHSGLLHCTYKQSTPTPSINKRFTFNNSFSKLSTSLLDEIKESLTERFNHIFEQLNILLIEPRELYMKKPTIQSFKFDSNNSNDSYWVFNFSLEESPSSKFLVEMELENNTWYYSIKAINGSLLDYKNSLQWEDFLIDELIKHIKLVPDIRYKFLYQKVKFKYRKKYR